MLPHIYVHHDDDDDVVNDDKDDDDDADENLTEINKL